MGRARARVAARAVGAEQAARPDALALEGLDDLEEPDPGGRPGQPQRHPHAVVPRPLVVARQQKMPHQDFLLLALGDEASRRDGQAATIRAQRGHLDMDAQIDRWDETAKVEFDRALLNELVSLRFIESHHHVAIVGHVGVGKTFLAHALGHVACRRGYSVLALTADAMLKDLRHARLTQTHEKELRALCAVDLLIIDDFGMEVLNAVQRKDLLEVLEDRYGTTSTVITSQLDSKEWHAIIGDETIADAVCDRLVHNAHKVKLSGESIRKTKADLTQGGKPAK